MFNKKVTVRGHEYELQLVDTAGQDEFSIMPPNYSVDIHGYVLVYSIDSMKSFEVSNILAQNPANLRILKVLSFKYFSRCAGRCTRSSST